jgi:cytochrome c oxidase subunit I+III
MSALRLHRQFGAIWGSVPGWRGPLASVNHSDIGRRLILGAFVFFAIGGVLAMLIRVQLATPDSAFVDAAVFNQLFTLHGSVMMFLFAIPMLEGLAIYLLPKLLGARDLAFPRLSAYGWWCFLFGGSLLVSSLLFGVAPDGGWFLYTPLSSRPYSPGINADFWLLGITFVEISALGAAVEIVVSILRLRAPGMSLARMPLFAWYLLATASMMLVAFPPLILGSILLELERAFDWPFFAVDRGGDALLWQHLFWLFGHPEVYIIFLPAAGVVSTVLPVMARTPILGHGAIVAALLALATLSFGLWVHHMFTVGIPHMALAFFSAASTLVAIPTAVQVFAWIGTLWKGRPQRNLPMLYLLGFFVVFTLGGLTGVMVAVVPFDWQAHDTAFVTAHLHYVLVGGFVFPMLAGAYYWLPHFTGRQRSYRLGEAAFWLIFVGFNLTFFLMHLAGLLGQPRRIDHYSAETGWGWINLLSSVGSFVMAIGVALFALDVLWQVFLARRSPRNPWQAGTLEWSMATPPPPYNLASLPTVEDREPLHSRPDLAVALARGEGYLGVPRNGWRETLAVHPLSGRIEQVVILPGNTCLPLWTALVTGAFFVALLLKLYGLAPWALLGVVGLGWRWAWELGSRDDHGELPIGHGARAPSHDESPGSPGWWGSSVLLVADGTLLVSLLFGHAYLWTVAPHWPPPQFAAVSPAALVLCAAGALLASWPPRGAPRPTPVAARALAAQLLLSAALLVLLRSAVPPPTSHAYAATLTVLLGHALLHTALAALLLVFVIARDRAGFLSARRIGVLAVALLWSRFAVVAAVVSVLVLHLPAWLA